MAKSDIEEIGETLHALATPGLKPKDLLKAVREKHPKASKKTIVRAAFYSIIANSERDEPAKAQALHNFAIAERGSDQ
jgi:hypothetical protein